MIELHYLAEVAGPRPGVWVTGLMGALTVPFAIPHASEILALLKLPVMDRRTALEITGVALRAGLGLSAYFGLLQWLGIASISVSAPLCESKLACLEHISRGQRHAGSH